MLTIKELDHCGLDAVAGIGRFHDLICQYHGIIPTQDLLEFLGMVNAAKAHLKMAREEFPTLVKEFSKAA